MRKAPPQFQVHLSAVLANRCLIRVRGDDAAHFLNMLLTVDISALLPGTACPAALLSPQGKILFDFLIAAIPAADNGETGNTRTFLIDIAAPLAENLIARLLLYKLRAKVHIEQPQPCRIAIFTSEKIMAAAHFPAAAQQEAVSTDTSRRILLGSYDTDDKENPDNKANFALQDARFPTDSVWRAYSLCCLDDMAKTHPTEQNWERLRIAFCLPESGQDFILGDNFPHDVNYDCIGAVARQKGCYIGQEVVSRMQHKAIIRKRLLQVTAEQNLPPQGTEILAEGKIIGKLGTVNGKQGLALVRTDKIPPQNSATAEQAPAAEPATAGGIALYFTAPPYLPPLLQE